MNIQSKTVAIVLLLVFIFSNVASTQAVVETQSVKGLNQAFATSQAHQESGEVEVLKEDQQGISFSVQVPWTQLELRSEEVDGKVYTEVSLPGWLETMTPGAPQLPYLTEQLGAPVGVEISLQITTGKSHEFVLAHPLLPSVTQRISNPIPETNAELLSLPVPEMIVEIDPLIYTQAQPYPEQLAILASDGFLRQQRVLGVNLFPIQLLPSRNTLVVYESLEVQVLFIGKALTTVDSKKPESAVYEQLFKDTLLNYEIAIPWRAEQSETSGLAIQSSVINAAVPWTPPNPGWRIKTTGEGMHKITYAELTAAGLQANSLNPQSFQLFHNGVEVAIQVMGESDGKFNAEDYLVFYAQIINTKYTAENVYWLTHGKTTQGLRMLPLDGTPGEYDTPLSFTDNKRIEGNSSYLSTLPGNDNVDRWVGKYLFPTVSGNPKSLVYNFQFQSFMQSDITLKLAVMGGTQHSINPDHHLIITLNSEVVGDFLFDGKSYQIFEMTVPFDVFIAGENLLEMIAPNDTGVGFDMIYIDWFELIYASDFVASQGNLAFEYVIPGTSNFKVTGFNSELITVYDVTEPTALRYVSGTQILVDGESYTLSFQDTIATSKRYFVVENTALMSVKAIELDTISSLSLPTTTADYIVITPFIFKDQATILANYRSSQGLRTKVVELQDIYDEFGYGLQDVSFIREFLSYAYHNWQAPAPAYVVLLGDGNYDPKKYVSTSLDNHMPTYLGAVDPWIVETAADNRYVTFVGEDTLPDMMLGRLTANDVAEATVLINKIMTYEATTLAEPWKQKLLFVADNTDSAGNFAQMSDNLISCCLPGIYQSEKVYFVPTSPQINPDPKVNEAKSAILNVINQGVLLVNYIGHAAGSQWTGEGVFKSTDISLLNNPNTLPIILSMTCYDGYYHYPIDDFKYEALAEVFTRTAAKGAVASWSPTGLGVASGHDYLNRGFYDALFKNGATTIGEATTAGKLRLWSTGSNLDLLDTYLLFGDPALRITTVANSNHPPIISEGSSTSVTMSEDGSPIAFAKTLHASDQDGDTLTWSISGAALHGAASASGTGTSKTIAYVPEANYYGTDMFVVQVSDSRLADNIVINVIIDPVNDAPIASVESYTTAEDQPLTIAAPGVLSNDTDVDGDTLTALPVSGSGPTHGTLALNLIGSFTYTPTPNYYGSDSFSYRPYDGNLYSAPVVVNLTITAVNDAPTAFNDSYVFLEDQVLEVTTPGVLLNDFDPESNLLTAKLVKDSGPAHGNIIFNSNGSFNYTPAAGFSGSDSFIYEVSDGLSTGNSAIVSLAVTAVNHAPIADNDSFSVADDQTLTIPALGVLDGDSDPEGDSLTVVLISGTGHGQLSLQSDGSFTYSPYSNFHGSDSFSYRAGDGNLLSNMAIVSLTVTSVNDAPVIDDILDQTITEGQSFTTIALDDYVSDPDHLDSELDWTTSGAVDLMVNIVDRVATITAPADRNGSETITFRATDPEGDYDEDAAIFTVTKVEPVQRKIFLPIIFR